MEKWLIPEASTTAWLQTVLDDGVTTRVPFKPQEGRGVYCPECYQALKALTRSSNDEESL